MTRSPLLARKYATALYDATSGKAALKSLAEKLPGLEAELARPQPSAEQALVLLGGPTSLEITNLIKILVRRKRLRLLPEIVETYTLIAEEHQGIKRATVTVATPLDATTRGRMPATPTGSTPAPTSRRPRSRRPA